MPGYKNFIDSQILSADNFMDYIMKQAVIVTDSTSDRDSSLAPYVREGMVCYVKDIDQLMVYVGTSWVRIATYSEATSSSPSRENLLGLYMDSLDKIFVIR